VGKVHVSVNGTAAGETVKPVTGYVAVAGVEALSVTLTVKDNVPLAVGVPEMAPVEELMVIHAGAPVSE
jgi:hypothetical protein